MTFRNLYWLIFLLISLPASAQVYLTGEIKDYEGVALQNVKIFVPSIKRIFHTGFGGKFGILIPSKRDSLIITNDGYDSLNVRLTTDGYQQFRLMKSIEKEPPVVYKEMVSFTSGTEKQMSLTTALGGETYNNLVENPFVQTDHGKTTTWGLKIDKASYSNVRRIITKGSQVPADAVRVEEMINYFNANYQRPDGEQKFRVESKLTDCLWRDDRQLLMLNISAQKLNLDRLPPSNIVLLIDISGSMEMPNKLDLIKESLPILVDNLRPEDVLSIVTYGGSVGLWLHPTSGNEKDSIKRSIEKLYASGDTPGARALREAYQVAETHYIKGGNNRIILATDGDFNVGQVSEKELERLIASRRDKGIYLSCLGVGMGNYKESKLFTLAKNGKGNFAYIDDINEAEKVFLNEFTQTMYTVADKTYADIHFDSSKIKEYRLIGYDNYRNNNEDFISLPIGGSIGSGFGTTVLFEILPVGKKLNENIDLGTLEIHYAEPGDTVVRQNDYRLKAEYSEYTDLPQSLRFVNALALFGLKLKASKYLPAEITWAFVRDIALDAYNRDDYLQNQFLDLIERVGDFTKRERKKFISRN